MVNDPETPTVVDDAPTAPVNEARAALIAVIVNDPARAADIILTCRDLVLSFDDRLIEAYGRIERAEKLALEAIRLAERRS
jgi:hypothetical protein